MLLSIIIVNYKKPEMTFSCIDSIYSNLGKEIGASIVEVVLVDNGSDKNDLGKLRSLLGERKYKNFSLIINKENGGFSIGCNTGAKSAKGDLLLFLNNDTIITDRRLMDMAFFLNNGGHISILGGSMVNADGTDQSSFGKFYTPFYVALFILGLERLGTVSKSPKDVSKVDWVKGSLLMVKRKVFEELNGFDEKIFMYMEDVEFCYRAKNAGFDTYFYPYISIIHKDQGSSSRSFAVVNIYKSLLYFYKKHRGVVEYWFVKYALMVKALILIIVGRIIRNSYLITTYEKALAVAR